MRTDARIDGKQVLCRNASLIGYSSRYLRVGMLFTHRADADDQIHLARMLGRVAYAPALNGDKDPVRNWILAMQLSANGTHAYERWVNPLDVVETIPEAPSAFAAFFFAPKLPYDAQTVRRLMEQGTISHKYIQNAPTHVLEWARREALADVK